MKPLRGIPKGLRHHDTVLSRECAAIAFLSLAALSLEISLTRILSLVEWYHFAFMVVSIALFGYGGAGAVLSLFPSLRRSPRVIPVSAGLCCISVVLSLVFAAVLRFDPIKANANPLHLVVILFQYLALGLPFLFTGICLASLITRHPNEANLIYFADLSGAGAGCIFALALLPLGGPQLVILGSALAASVACALFAHSEGFTRLGYMAAAGAAVLVLATGAILNYDPKISQYKSLSAVMRNPDAEKLWSTWNSISRVDAVKSGLIRHAPGMAFDVPRWIPEQIGITVDGDNLEPITRFDGNFSALGFMGALPSAIPYEIRPRQRVLVIDSGGGFDVLAALRNGASEVVATEQNPSIVKAVREEFGNFSGNLYTRQDVEVHVSDARSYLASSEELFDLIEISLKQDPVTASVGLYSLSESYLFTTESFRELLHHLSEDGMLVVTRWLSPPPRQGARVAAIMVDALEEEGVEDPSLHLASFRTYLTLTTMMKRNRFWPNEISTLRAVCEDRRYDVVYLPGITAEEVNRFNIFDNPDYYRVFQKIVHPAAREEFFQGYFFDISAPKDEKPFYFDFLKWSRIWELRRILGPAWNPYLEGGLLVVAVLVQATIASAAFILTPVLLSSRAGQSVRRKGRWVVYFLCLGAAYMLIEVTFLQRFILFLGQPAYAMAAVLFAMLTFSGLGSLWSGRFQATARVIGLSVLGVMCLIGLQSIFMGPVIRAFLGSHIWVKFGISLALIAPLAFLMGIPFPMGLRILGRKNSDVIPLAYCANGCSSVIGSAGTIVLAGWLGFSNVLLAGALVYMVSYLSLPVSR